MLILFAAIIISISLIKLAPSAAVQPEKSNPVLITSVKLASANNVPNLLLYGKAESSRHVNLSSKVNAKVVGISAEEGMRVKAGSILMQLDTTDVMHELTKAEHYVQENKSLLRQGEFNLSKDQLAIKKESEILSLQKKRFERANTLIEKNQGLISQQQLDADRTAFLQAKIQFDAKNNVLKILQHNVNLLTARLGVAKVTLQQLQEQLNDCIIKTPVDGIVTKLHVAQHEEVRLGQTLIDVLPTDQIEVRALIPNSNIAQLNQLVDSDVSIKAEATLPNNQQLGLKLHYLTSIIKPGSIGREAIFKTIKAHDALADGEHMTLLVDLAKVPNSFKIPAKALYRNYDLDGKEGSYIYKIKENKLQRVEVEQLGYVFNHNKITFVVIKPKLNSDLQSNDFILAQQLPNAMSGLLVKMASPVTGGKVNG